MGVVVRDIDDTGVIVVGWIVEPDMVRDDIGGGMSMVGIEIGLGGGSEGGGDGERVDRSRGGGISETGISEISPVFPSISGDSAEGGEDGSITMLLRKGETARRDGVLRSGEEAESRALGGPWDF